MNRGIDEMHGKDDVSREESVTSVLRNLDSFADKCLEESRDVTKEELSAFLLMLGEVRRVDADETGGLKEEPGHEVGRRFLAVGARRYFFGRVATIAVAVSVVILLGLVLLLGGEPMETRDDRVASRGDWEPVGRGDDSTLHEVSKTLEMPIGAETRDADGQAIPVEPADALVKLMEMAQNLEVSADELAVAYLGNYGENYLGDTRSPRDGELFLDVVRSDWASAEVRSYAAWALRSFEENWDDLGRLLTSDRGEEFVLGVIQGIPVESVNEAPEVLLRSLFDLVAQGTNPLRRKAASKLVGYLDPEGAFGRVCLARIVLESDLGTLRSLLESHALGQALVSNPEFPERILDIAEGHMPGAWENPTGRAARSAAFRLMAKASHPRATTLFLNLLGTDQLLAKDLVLVFLEEPELMRVSLSSARRRTYEAFGRVLQDGAVERSLLLTALLKADGAGAISGLSELQESEPDWSFSPAQMLSCEEELFAASGHQESLERYLLERLRGYEGPAGKELFGLCHLLIRLETDEVRRALLEESDREELAPLVRAQLYLAWLQMSPELADLGSVGRDLLDGVRRSLHSLDPDEVTTVLSGAVPLPAALRVPDVIDALISLIEKPPSNFPAFPFLAIPELYRLRNLGVEVERELRTFTAPLLEHQDWRVRLATALARFDGGDGQIGEVSVVVRSVGNELLADGSRPEVLTDDQLMELRDRVARIRPYSLKSVVTGRPDPETARRKAVRFGAQLREKLGILRECRRDVAHGVEAILEEKGHHSVSVQRNVLNLLLLARAPEMKTAVARSRDMMTDTRLAVAVDAILGETWPGSISLELPGMSEIQGGFLRGRWMDELEGMIEALLARTEDPH